MFINNPGHMTKMAAMPIYESMSKFVKILVFSIFYENHLPDPDLNFFI